MEDPRLDYGAFNRKYNPLYNILEFARDWRPLFIIGSIFTGVLFYGGYYFGSRLETFYQQKASEFKQHYNKSRDSNIVLLNSIQSQLDKCLSDLNSITYSSVSVNQPEQDGGVSELEGKVRQATDSAKPIADRARDILKGENIDSDKDGIPDIKDNCKWFYNPQQEEIHDRKICDTLPYTDKYGANMGEEDETAE